MFSLTIDEMPELVARQAAIHELRVLPVSYGTVVGLLDRLGLTGRREGFTWERHLNWLNASDQQTTLSVNKLSGGLQ